MHRARIDKWETVRYLYHVQIQQGDPAAEGGPPRQQQNAEPLHPRQSAPAAVASAAARARRARCCSRAAAGFCARHGAPPGTQQRDLQYQTGAAQAEAPKPVKTGAKVGPQ